MANKKHYFLDDKEWLKKSRVEYTAQELADKEGCSRGSVEWACRCFSEDVKATFKSSREGKHIKAIKAKI